MCRCCEGVPDQVYPFSSLSDRRRRSASAPGVLRTGTRRLCHGVSLTLLLEKIVHRHPPPRHSWLCIGNVPSAEEYRMLGISGLVGSNHVLA